MHHVQQIVLKKIKVNIGLIEHYTLDTQKKKGFFYLYSHVYLYHTILNKIMVEY